MNYSQLKQASFQIAHAIFLFWRFLDLARSSCDKSGLIWAPRPLSKSGKLNTLPFDNSVPECKINFIALFFITFPALISACSSYLHAIFLHLNFPPFLFWGWMWPQLAHSWEVCFGSTLNTILFDRFALYIVNCSILCQDLFNISLFKPDFCFTFFPGFFCSAFSCFNYTN